MNVLRLNLVPTLLFLLLFISTIYSQKYQVIDLNFCIETFQKHSPIYQHLKLEAEKEREQFRANIAFKYPDLKLSFNSPYTFSKDENEVFYSIENEYRLVRRNTHNYMPSFTVRSDYYLPFDGRLSSAAGVYYNRFQSNLSADRQRFNTFIDIDYEQPLFRKNHYSLDSKIVEKEFRKAELRFNAERNKLIANVIDRFYLVLRAQQVYELLRSQLRHKQLTHNFMKDKFNLGKISELEFLQADIDYRNSQLNVLNQKELLENEIAQLCFLIGISPDTSYRCSAELNLESFELSLEDCLERAISQNPEISISFLSKEISDLRIQKAMAGDGLNLSLVSSLTVDNRRDYLPVIYDSRFYNWSMSLRASLPLWDGGKSGAERNVEQIRRRQEEINLKTMENSLIQKIKKLYSAIRFEKNRIEILSKKRELTRKALELSRRLNEAGRLNMRELIESEINAKRADIDWMNSIINYNKRVITLKLETGMDLGL
ncbi:MAG: hypothetical protein Kow0037_26720 [Calditrichia bacterium]